MYSHCDQSIESIKRFICGKLLNAPRTWHVSTNFRHNLHLGHHSSGYLAHLVTCQRSLEVIQLYTLTNYDKVRFSPNLFHHEVYKDLKQSPILIRFGASYVDWWNNKKKTVTGQRSGNSNYRSTFPFSLTLLKMETTNRDPGPTQLDSRIVKHCFI